MNINEIINDLKKLKGLQLSAINAATGILELVEVNTESSNYKVRINDMKTLTKPLSQIEKIWNVLLTERVANVEIVLEGAGSRRHIPETLLANLPFIEHFKYGGKKHLHLKDENTHDYGTLKSVESKELREVKSRLTNLKKFDRSQFSVRLDSAVNFLDEATAELKVKFPGEFEQSKLSKVEQVFLELYKEVSGTVIPRQSANDYISILADGDEMIDLDAPEFTGYEGADEDDGELDFLEGEKQLAPSRIRFLPFTVSLIYDRIRHDEIELQPEFQRKDRIWPLTNKSALIESLLIGLPIPTFYFAERRSGAYVIVDGLQRITTFFDFMKGDFKLSNLKFRPELSGKMFKELPRPDQRKIREYQLYAYIISIRNDDDKMVRELFQRINTYGVKMSYQEIRCALFPGSSVRFLKLIAEHPAFKNATFGKIQPKRMRDMEFILGALGFVMFGYKNFEHKKFDDFLTKTMRLLNKKTLKLKSQSGDILVESNIYSNIDIGSDELFENLSKKLEDSFYLASEIFGKDRYKKQISGRVINKSLFELVTAVFALIDNSYHGALLANRKKIKNGLYDFIEGNVEPPVQWTSDAYHDRGFEHAITQSTSKHVTILYRFDNFISLLEQKIGRPISISGLLE